MPKFNIDDILRLMKKPKQIRNISVIAHVDHGKSTLTDSLITEAGMMSEKHTGTQDRGRVTDTMELEKLKGITIQSTAVSLYYSNRHRVTLTEEEKSDDESEILVHLIDSPGHVDFSSEVTAALRVTDGALVVVDCLEGVCVQTETVLRQAISERIRPILFLNKLDRIFLETKPPLEDAYITLRNSIESVNVICQTYRDEKLGDIELTCQSGKVGFGSALHAWGFTLLDFARMYCSKFGLSEAKLMKKLWGNNYFDTKKGEWVNKASTGDGRVLERSFVTFVLRPIRVMCDSIMEENKKVYEPVIKALRLKFSKEHLQAVKKPKDYLKLVMRTWLPCGETLLEMIGNHLPSPVEAQKYRVESLYTGNLKSPEADAIRNCDISGPLSMYVSKMVPDNNGRFVAFGRIFSGEITQGKQLRIMGPDYNGHLDNGEEEEHKSNSRRRIKDLSIKKSQALLLMMAKDIKSIPACYAGNVCSVVGIDDAIKKNATVTDSKTMCPFKMMKFSVSAVVQYAVNVKNSKDLPELIKGMNKLSQVDQIIKTFVSKNKECIIAGAGELHLEVSINRLENEFMKDGVEVVKSEPIVSINESVSILSKCDLKTDKTEANLICAKSPNRHNRLYMTAQPLSSDFVVAVDNNEIDLNLLKDTKAFGKILTSNSKFGWEKSDAESIWTFGCPPDAIPSVLVDLTKGEQNVREIRPHMTAAFMSCTNKGVLCGENLRGIRFNLRHVKLHPDSIHRGDGQIIPATRKAIYGCQLASGPVLMQPVYQVEITTDLSCQNGVISALLLRQGQYEETIFKQGTLCQVKGYLPVLQSFGFTGFLREKVGGKAFPQMTFSHWIPMKGDPLEKGTPAYQEMMKIRERKDMSLELPVLSEYFDRSN